MLRGCRVGCKPYPAQVSSLGPTAPRFTGGRSSVWIMMLVTFLPQPSDCLSIAIKRRGARSRSSGARPVGIKPAWGQQPQLASSVVSTEPQRSGLSLGSYRVILRA